MKFLRRLAVLIAQYALIWFSGGWNKNFVLSEFGELYSRIVACPAMYLGAGKLLAESLQDGHPGPKSQSETRYLSFNPQWNNINASTDNVEPRSNPGCLNGVSRILNLGGVGKGEAASAAGREGKWNTALQG